MSDLKSKAYALHQQGGASAVIEEARACQHPDWGRCSSCARDVPLTGGQCLLCGHATRAHTLPNPTMLAAFKRALATHDLWEVRYDHRPGFWHPNVVVHLQSNAVAFARSIDPTVIDKCRERPRARASWHWWRKATTYRPSPDNNGALRVLIGTSWEDPHAGWMEYRSVQAYPALENGLP